MKDRAKFLWSGATTAVLAITMWRIEPGIMAGLLTIITMLLFVLSCIVDSEGRSKS